METMYEVRLINDYNASLAIYFSHFYHHSKTMIVINNKKKYAEIFTSPWYADNEDGMDPNKLIRHIHQSLGVNHIKTMCETIGLKVQRLGFGTP
jgi:hypothetical protein